MRTSAIIRIIIFAFIAIMLTTVLVAGIVGGQIFGNIHCGFFSGVFNSYDNRNYTVGGGSFDAQNISEIEVNWTSGKVIIEPTNGNQIELSEEYSGSLEDEDKMRYKVEGGKLTVNFRASRRFFWFGFSNFGSKTVTLKIPSTYTDGFKKLTVDAVSANVTASGVSPEVLNIETVSGSLSLADSSAKDINLNSTSGRITAEAVKCERLDVETVSGRVELAGEADNIDGSSVSGSIETDLDICPSELRFETVSGKITVGIPDNDGFTANYDTVSGKFTTGSFAVAMDSKEKVIYKNGSAKFRFESVSGNILIEKRS